MKISGNDMSSKEIGYLFVDGEQLNGTLKEVGAQWFGKAIDINYAKLKNNNQKAFYYDCLPAKNENENDEQYELKKTTKTAIFEGIRSGPGWHVSQGIAKHRKRFGQTQKEVDILIAVDMLTHTHRRNMQRLTFLSGDQDFAPLIETVVREGMYVELLYPEGHTSRDLISFADEANPLNIDFLYTIATDSFQREHKMPTKFYEFEAVPKSSVLIAEAFLDEKLKARMWKDNYGTYHLKLIERTSAGQHYTVVFNDEVMAKKYFGILAGELNWLNV